MVKRAFDLIASVILLIILSPVMLLAAFAVLLLMGRPVIFSQTRPGLHGKLFNIYKFRSMTDAKAEDGNLLPGRQRLTMMGRILRASSLDELPELFNVLKGDMSLVGPRPLRVEYLERYTSEQARRHNVKPGITGLAQISGRNSIPFSKRIELDIRYVDQRSFWLDIKILLATPLCVLWRHGVCLEQTIDKIDDLGLSAKPLEGQRMPSEAGDQG